MTREDLYIMKNKIKGKPIQIKKSSKQFSAKVVVKSLILTLMIAAILYYLFFPAINPASHGFWCFLMVLLAFYSTFHMMFAYLDLKELRIKPYLLLLAALVLYLGASLLSSKLFNADKYANVLQVNEEADFVEDMAETVTTDAIALMDTASAKMLGDREIGSLSKVVSQYDVSDDYMQIDYQGRPVKVSGLQYSGFLRWFNNRNEGVPGYVTVDPVSMSADYHECEGMIYVPSACFGQYLDRHIQMRYSTQMLGESHFEIDEDGKPFYVCPVYKKTTLLGGKTVKGAIVADPCSGDLTYYPVEEVPRWVDMVYSGDLLCEQYNWYGNLKNGFMNSIFGKKGCKRVTEYRSNVDEDDEEEDAPANDYGYIAKDGDIWIYTGVTSVNKDSSNIGFLLANERTGEARYYAVSGADESSAMSAAEGEVQEKGYQASFPSLINIDGVPTYIMVLKDNSGLVKLYAAVNVEQYNIVATAGTQKECIEKYRSLIGAGVQVAETDPDNLQEKVITIAERELITMAGDTYLYIVTSEQEIFRTGAIGYEGNEKALLLHEGDTITIRYSGNVIAAWE